MPSAANVVVGIILGIVYLLILVLGSMALVIGFQQIREAVRIVWQGPTAASDVDPGGWAMVRGTVHPTGAPVTGPLSGRESACVACRIEGLRKLLWISSWVTEHETVVGTRFEVTDGTGTTHVEPVGADISVDDDRTVSRLDEGVAVVAIDECRTTVRMRVVARGSGGYSTSRSTSAPSCTSANSVPRHSSPAS